MAKQSHSMKWRSAEVLSRKFYQDEHTEKLSLISQYDELEKAKAPERPNLAMNALFLLESAIKLMCVGAANPQGRATDLINKLLRGARELADATFARKAFWAGKPGSPPDHPAEKPRWHAEATRVQVYSSALLGEGTLDKGKLTEAGKEFDFAAETYREQRIWNVSTKPHVFSAVRMALLGHDVEGAVEIANKKRAFSDFPAQIAIHRRFAKAVADARGGVIAPSEAEAFEDYFDKVRMPVYKDVVDSLGESIYCSKLVALMEWAVLMDRHVHGRPVEDWDRVFGYIVA